GPAQACSAAGLVEFPGVVQEIHPAVERLVHDAYGLANRAGLPDVITADPEDRDPIVVSAERRCCDRLHRASSVQSSRPAGHFDARRTLCVRSRMEGNYAEVQSEAADVRI